MDVLIKLNLHSFWQITGFILFICLLVYVPGRIVYEATKNDFNRGFQAGINNTSKVWQARLSHLSEALVVFNAERQIQFQSKTAAPLLKQLDADTLERIHLTDTQGKLIEDVVNGKDGRSIKIRAWALLDKSQNGVGVVLSLEDDNTSQEKFMRSLNHELYKPLQTIKMQLDSIAGHNGVDAAHIEQILGITLSETNRLIRLVDGSSTILNIESSNQTKWRVLQISRVVEDASILLYPLADEREIEIILQDDDALPPVLIDEDAWRQLFVNLVDNAIKYGKRGGTILVEIQHKAPNLRITVTDDGPGIPKEEQVHLFQEFYRGSKNRHSISGSGLGLAIVYRVVKQHKGEIRCISKPGGGTTFEILLPVKRETITNT